MRLITFKVVDSVYVMGAMSWTIPLIVFKVVDVSRSRVVIASNQSLLLTNYCQLAPSQPFSVVAARFFSTRAPLFINEDVKKSSSGGVVNNKFFHDAVGEIADRGERNSSSQFVQDFDLLGFCLFSVLSYIFYQNLAERKSGESVGRRS